MSITEFFTRVRGLVADMNTHWRADSPPEFQQHPAAAIAAFVGVSAKTVALWRSGAREPGPTARNLLQLYFKRRVLPHAGLWGEICAVWNTANPADSELVCSNGERFTASQLLHYRQVVSMAEVHAVENRELREYVAYLEAQLPRAPVVDLPGDRMRESATAGRELNPLFSKPWRD